MGAFQCENTVFFSRSFLETPTQNCDSWACFVKKWTFWVLECGDFWDSLMKFGYKNIAGSQKQVQLVPPGTPLSNSGSNFFGGFGPGRFAPYRHGGGDLDDMDWKVNRDTTILREKKNSKVI